MMLPMTDRSKEPYERKLMFLELELLG